MSIHIVEMGLMDDDDVNLIGDIIDAVCCVKSKITGFIAKHKHRHNHSYDVENKPTSFKTVCRISHEYNERRSSSSSHED